MWIDPNKLTQLHGTAVGLCKVCKGKNPSWPDYNWKQCIGCEPLKSVVVGDGATGKTCLLIVLSGQSFPTEYVPTVFDNWTISLGLEPKVRLLSLWDTAGPEDYDRLRPLSYPQTNVFIIAFSLISTTAYQNVKDKWYPEVTHHCPQAPLILVGTKKDLRDDPSMVSTLQQKGMTPVTREQGEQMAREIGAVCYIEVSSLTSENIKELFTAVIAAGSDLIYSIVGLPPSPATPKPECPVTLPPSKKHPADMIRKKLGSSFKDPKFSDITLTTDDSTELIPGHKVLLAAGSDYFYERLVGGDTRKSSTDDAVWKRQDRILLESECGRFGCTTFFDANQQTIYAVGGGDKGTGYVEDMVAINLKTDQRTLIPFKGEANKDYPKVNFHTTVTLPNENSTVLLFGGRCGGYFNNMWAFEAGQWKLLPPNGKPPAGRYGHTAVLHLNKMWVFGGYDTV